MVFNVFCHVNSLDYASQVAVMNEVEYIDEADYHRSANGGADGHPRHVYQAAPAIRHRYVPLEEAQKVDDMPHDIVLAEKVPLEVGLLLLDSL